MWGFPEYPSLPGLPVVVLLLPRSTTSILRFTYHLIWETQVICPQNSVPIPVWNTVSYNYLCLFLTLAFSSPQTVTLLY